MKILVINTGSSSIKFKLYELPAGKLICAGLLERIGESDGKLVFTRYTDKDDEIDLTLHETFSNHQVGLDKVANLLLDPEFALVEHPRDIRAVGHRVVHGGEDFREATCITHEVVDKIERLIPLAPLHNPANIEGIKTAMQVFPDAQQVAVFDTAFHHTIPEHAFRYAIPTALYQERGLRVYGMHGTSHQYVAHKAAQFIQKPLGECNFITIHLGNGCSMTAVSGGKSIDTSMGLSPLPGLVMGTRSGDIDPAVIFYLSKNLNMSVEEIDQMLNKESGLKGLTGSNDLRDIIQRAEAGDQAALLAIEMYTYRIRKYIGAYATVLGRLDGIIFTAGVGENSPLIRHKACERLELLGIMLDPGRNEKREKGSREIQAAGSKVRLLVIPTNEELEIAQQTFEAIS